MRNPKDKDLLQFIGRMINTIYHKEETLIPELGGNWETGMFTGSQNKDWYQPIRITQQFVKRR